MRTREQVKELQSSEKHGKFTTTCKVLVASFFSSQLFGHLLKLINLNFSGGYTVMSTYSLQTIHPVLFSLFRTIITSLCLFPAAMIIDFRYEFPSQKKSNSKLIQSIYYDHSLQGQQEFIFSKQSSFFFKVFQKIRSKIPSKQHFKLLLLCGICLMSNQIFYTLGLLWVSPVVAAVFQPAIAAFTCILSILVKKEKFSLLKLIGVFVAICGAVAMLLINSLVAHSSHSSKEKGGETSLIGWKPILGTLCLFVNTISYSFYLIFQKALLDKKVPPITITAYCFTIECVLLTCISIPFFSQLHWNKITTMAWIGVLYSGICLGAIAYSLGSFAARILSPTMVSIYSCVSPVFAALYMFVFLGHVPSPYVLIGVALITTGVVMVIIARYREKKKVIPLITSSNPRIGNIQEEEEDIGS